MCSITLVAVVSVLATALASAGNSTLDVHSNVTDTDTCGLQPGPWAAALELWATTDQGQHTRQGRIMALPPSQGYYVTDRIDLMPPPPPPSHHQMHPQQHHPQSGPHNSGPQHHNSGPPHHNSGPQYQTQSGPLHHTQAGPPQQPPGRPYEEWQVTPPPPPSTSKIVNRPPNPYKDKFRPSYPVSSGGQPIPVDRVDEPSASHTHKQVSETDLFLLSAIEKLVYRVDVMEKRLRKMEESVHYLVAGTHTKPEPCVSNFTRVGASCYHFSTGALNWQSASVACRALGAALLELDAPKEKKILQSTLLADKRLKGVEWWTGGLNPGLLWIWSHSARPVSGNQTSTDTDTSTVVGSGRCLSLVPDPAFGAYMYRGQDCSLPHRYVCETLQPTATTKLSNEIQKLAKMMRLPAGTPLDRD